MRAVLLTLVVWVHAVIGQSIVNHYAPGTLSRKNANFLIDHMTVVLIQTVKLSARQNIVQKLNGDYNVQSLEKFEELFIRC
jgi:hypothetical protein